MKIYFYNTFTKKLGKHSPNWQCNSTSNLNIDQKLQIKWNLITKNLKYLKFNYQNIKLY